MADDVERAREHDLDERARIGCDAVVEAAIRYAAGESNEDELIASCVGQEIVEQRQILRVPVNDVTVPRRGPIQGLVKARQLRLVGGSLYDRILNLMASTGHRS